MFKRNRQKGFTLIELLIVVAIIGIIAAILIPNLLDALQKAKQKRTVADMRDVGTAWMSWLVDQNSAASAGQAAKTYPASTLGFTDVDYETIYGFLRPSNTFFYMQEIPEVDGWKNAFDYARNPVLSDSAVLLICSRGRDNAYTDVGSCAADWPVDSYIATDYDRDIAWADGYFVLGPGGLTTTSP